MYIEVSFVVNCIIHESKILYHIVIYQNDFFYLANLYIEFFSFSKMQKNAQILFSFMLIFDKSFSKHLSHIGYNQKRFFVKFFHYFS